MNVYSTEMIQDLQNRYPEAKATELINSEEFCVAACQSCTVMDQLHEFLIKGRTLYSEQMEIRNSQLSTTDTKVFSTGDYGSNILIYGAIGIGVLYAIKKITEATPMGAGAKSISSAQNLLKGYMK